MYFKDKLPVSLVNYYLKTKLIVQILIFNRARPGRDEGTDITQSSAKKYLSLILDSITPTSVLHLDRERLAMHFQ